MSQFKAMKFWTGADKDLSDRVQDLLFSMGYGWAANKNKQLLVESTTCFYTTTNGEIYFNSSYQNKHDFTYSMEGDEIDINWMRTPKKETIELNGKKYLKEDLEEALKHLKPVG